MTIARSLWLLVVACAALVVAPLSRASALVWPDIAEKIKRDMSSADPATRRSAARELVSLGPTGGALLTVTALADPDDEVRLAGADAAIRLRVPGATDAVAGWLNSPDVRLRKKACEVARALPGQRAVAPLARTLGDPDPDVRSAAALALGYQSSPGAVPPLLGRLDDPTPAVRVQIVTALARLGDPRAVVPLVGKVQDSSIEVRQTVAAALGDFGDSRASSALVLALRDPSDEVRREALAALGRTRAVDAVDAVAPFLTDRIASLRMAAFSALGRIASPDAVRLLIGALDGEAAAVSTERTAARDALVVAGSAALPQLQPLLGTSLSRAEVSGAAWVIGELHARSDAASIVGALRRGILPAAAALHALAGAGTSSEVPVVLEFLTDENPAVRREALGAAFALLDPHHPDGRAVEPLAAFLRDGRPSPQERARVAMLLGLTGAPRAAPLLVDLMRASDSTLRITAIDALGLLGPAGADDALVEAMGSSNASTRLHCALALSEAGGARSREALLAQLDGGDEVDHAAVLTALGGVLARMPTNEAVARLTAALDLAAGPERDAVIEALGRAPLPSAVTALTTLARGSEPSDRRAVAALLAGHRTNPAALETVRALSVDSDVAVRAEAVWSLGSLGDVGDIDRLGSVIQAAEIDPAANAAASVGRIAARLRAPTLAGRILCSCVSDARAYVRANSLAGLALAGARCGDGSLERTVLADDVSEDVRAAAALMLSRAPDPHDKRALERCVRSDPSGSVAARCRMRVELPAAAHAALVYVVGEGARTPQGGTEYAILLADGTIRTGRTDRRGATFDPVAPEGEVRLRSPSAIAH